MPSPQSFMKSARVQKAQKDDDEDKTSLAINRYGMRLAPREQRLHQWGRLHQAQMKVEARESESENEADENDTFDETPYADN